MAIALKSMSDLIDGYFRLYAQLKDGNGQKAPLIHEQKKLVHQIFSQQSETPTDLNRKSEILLHLLEDEDSHYYSWNDKELFFANILHDIQLQFKNEKLSPSHSYTPEAAANYYNWMFGGLPR